jgi:choloylglycine hydrolase
MQSFSDTARSSWRALAKATMALFVTSALVAPHAAEACTSFLLPTSDGGSVYGRTMEFAFALDSQAIVIPRNFALAASGPDNKPGKTWNSKYATVGMNALGMGVLIDGLNEKGLAGGILYFPDNAEYTEPAKADPAKSLAPWDFLTWALTSFATVEEVKAALADVVVIDLVQEQLKITPPVHYTLHDASGASIVIEPVGGTLKVYDNPTTVMTNSPPFDWHMTNLRNYVKLSDHEAEPLKVRDMTIDPPAGVGSGMLGIPGDPTAPSRFIRAFAYLKTAAPVASGIESVRLAEHILNNFDLPKGYIRAKVPGQPDMLDYTQWSTIADLKNGVFYVKTYEDPTLRAVALKDFDLDGKTIEAAPMHAAVTPPALAFPKP